MQQFTAHVQYVAWTILAYGDAHPMHMSGCATRSSPAHGDTKIGRDRRVMRDGRGRRLRSICAERDSERASERVQMGEGSRGATRPTSHGLDAVGGLLQSSTDLTSRRDAPATRSSPLYVPSSKHSE